MRSSGAMGQLPCAAGAIATTKALTGGTLDAAGAKENAALTAVKEVSLFLHDPIRPEQGSNKPLQASTELNKAQTGLGLG